MAFWDLSALQLKEFRPGIMSVAEMGENLVMVCMEIGPGMEDTGHSHPFDQCGLVLQGEVEMFVDEERRVLRQGEAYFLPAGRRHGWKTFQGSVRILDVSMKQPRT
jgi:quercetin dioxygenase-like cupin family protein